MLTRCYKSTDLGAPLLTGQVDSLNNLLKAILIDGIGGAPASPWSLAYEDVSTHTCVFRPAAGNRHYLQVNENAPGAAGQREARLRGYVAMTGFNTGTEPFPTVAQQAAGIVCRKSATLDATARPWRAYVDEKTCYLFIDCGDLTATWDMYAFGQYQDWKPAGAYGSLITGRYIENQGAHSSATNGAVLMYPTTPTPVKIYAPREYTQAGTAVELGIMYDSGAVNSTTTIAPGSLGQNYPYELDGGLVMMPFRLTRDGKTVGRARGLWIPAHNKPLLQDDVFNATEGALSRAFIVQNLLSTGQLFLETSNTWDDD